MDPELLKQLDDAFRGYEKASAVIERCRIESNKASKDKHAFINEFGRLLAENFPGKSVFTFNGSKIVLTEGGGCHVTEDTSIRIPSIPQNMVKSQGATADR